MEKVGDLVEGNGGVRRAMGAPSDYFVDYVANALVFVATLTFSILAVGALIFAAPIAIALSTVLGLFSADRQSGGWRPARAAKSDYQVSLR